jgi:hypothetical protein
VAHEYSPSYSGGIGRRIRVSGWPGAKSMRPYGGRRIGKRMGKRGWRLTK